MERHNSALVNHLKEFASIPDHDIDMSLPFWKSRALKKGEFFNMQKMVCTDLGLVVKGIFRIYYRGDEHPEEKNLYFFSENHFVVSFRSFVTQKPCWYFIEAMEDSEIVSITHQQLNTLYGLSAHWSRFGRLLAEQFFSYAQARTEQFVFFSHEERYLRLLAEHPNIVARIPAYHISSYLGITNPSLSRIRKRIGK